MSKLSDWLDIEEIVKEAESKTAPPPMYKVVLNNDDYTPMEFVIEVLQLFFNMELDKATQVMLTIHYKGKGVCGVFTAEVAETKAAQVNSYAKQNDHPLMCTMEKAQLSSIDCLQGAYVC